MVGDIQGKIGQGILGTRLERSILFTMNAPPLTLTFNVPTMEEPEGFEWGHFEEALLEKLETSEGYQKELRRTLFANSFRANDRMMCSFEAIYTIARLLFAFAPDLEKEDWPLVNNTTRNNPVIILIAIGFDPLEFIQIGDFCFFKLDGISTDLTPDIQSVINAVLDFKKIFQGHGDREGGGRHDVV